ncbi:MAG: LamB/YcsF family protein [Actinomycetota bacterium]|nr:LamB/YcsF family protein [Actinomycetota bacterium]
MRFGADVGETFRGNNVGDDESVIPLVDVANIACGGHGGTKESITRAVDLCTQHGVMIAAHPSYFDPYNFGRLSQSVTSGGLLDQMKSQFDFLSNIVGYLPEVVKAHGALYNDMFADSSLATWFLESIDKIYESSPSPLIVGAPGSTLEQICAIRGYRFLKEGFADRMYLEDGSLAPRSNSASLLNDPNQILRQIESISNDQQVEAASGKIIPLTVDVVCFHGDHTPSIEALALAQEFRMR